jgi:hypothetical protein
MVDLRTIMERAADCGPSEAPRERVSVTGTREQAPPGESLATGTKYDADKPRWDLLPFDALASVVHVLTVGARKYAPHNWQKVPDARSRYLAALLRHVSAWANGQETDPDTGVSHMAHVACCALFLTWFDVQRTTKLLSQAGG